MISLINFLHSAFGLLVAALLAPFGSMSPMYGLLFISGVCGIGLLLMYGKVSNQKAIKRVKTAIYADVLECVIFRHDVRLCLVAQSRLLKNALLYFCFAVPPLLILCVPCLLVLAQLNLRYESRGFRPGESALLTVKLDSPKSLYDLSLQAAPDLDVAGPLRVPTTREVVWRIKFKKNSASRFDLRLQVGGHTYPIDMAVGGEGRTLENFSQSFYSSSAWRLLYPLGRWGRLPEISAAPFESISISYPHANYTFLGFDMSWVVIFFIVSLLTGLVASRYFKVEI